jgi:hypothetical protein
MIGEPNKAGPLSIDCNQYHCGYAENQPDEESELEPIEKSVSSAVEHAFIIRQFLAILQSD